jgi:hypothetical protein
MSLISPLCWAECHPFAGLADTAAPVPSWHVFLRRRICRCRRDSLRLRPTRGCRGGERRDHRRPWNPGVVNVELFSSSLTGPNKLKLKLRLGCVGQLGTNALAYWALPLCQ